MCWTSDDFHLVSTGQDGATYEYDILKEGRRVSDARICIQNLVTTTLEGPILLEDFPLLGLENRSISIQ